MLLLDITRCICDFVRVNMGKKIGLLELFFGENLFLFITASQRMIRQTAQSFRRSAWTDKQNL